MSSSISTNEIIHGVDEISSVRVCQSIIGMRHNWNPDDGLDTQGDAALGLLLSILEERHMALALTRADMDAIVNL